MYIHNNKLEILSGIQFTEFKPKVPFSDVVCDFIYELSSELLKCREAKNYPDIISFAYWCRKSNINSIKIHYNDNLIRVGIGVVLHITPSNIPVNFAFSFIFGIISGSANIVRAPSVKFRQTDIICNSINKLFNNKKYVELKSMNFIVRYEKDDNITQALSSVSNARIIWGGKETIKELRSFTVNDRCVDIYFSDRYSICVIDSSSILQLGKNELTDLAQKFYNDTYLFDQNACSSPHLVVWIGKDNHKAKEIFWSNIKIIIDKKYNLKSMHMIDKYNNLCSIAIEVDQIKSVNIKNPYLYRILLDKLPNNLDEYKGCYGLFMEYDAEDINKISPVINNAYQTITYFGINKLKIKDFVINNRLMGIDNITPIGTALEIGVFWDGYDIIRSLTRIINIK